MLFFCYARNLFLSVCFCASSYCLLQGNLTPLFRLSRLSGMLDDFEDDIVDIAKMDDTQHEKSNALPYRKSSKQRTLSQMVGEAGSYPKKSKV